MRALPCLLSAQADPVEHVAKVPGHDHVGFAADFDGEGGPLGLEDVSTYPAILSELLRRGWRDRGLAKLAGGNFIRAFAAAERDGDRPFQPGPPPAALRPPLRPLRSLWFTFFDEVGRAGWAGRPGVQRALVSYPFAFAR